MVTLAAVAKVLLAAASLTAGGRVLVTGAAAPIPAAPGAFPTALPTPAPTAGPTAQPSALSGTAVTGVSGTASSGLSGTAAGGVSATASAGLSGTAALSLSASALTLDLLDLPPRPTPPAHAKDVAWEDFTVVTLISAPFTALWDGLGAYVVGAISQDRFSPAFTKSLIVGAAAVAGTASVTIGLVSVSWGRGSAPASQASGPGAPLHGGTP